MTDQPHQDLEKTGYGSDSQKTLEEIFDDDEEEEEEDVEIVEYVDMVDEGYFAPTFWMLLLLGLVVVGAAAGVGVGIYYVWEDRNGNDPTTPASVVPPPTPTPTVPIVIEPTNSPTTKFQCNICPNNGNVTIPEGIVNIVGEPLCIDLQQRAEAAFTEDQCERVHAFTVEPCGCSNGGVDGDSDSDSSGVRSDGEERCTVCTNGAEIGNPNGIVNVTSLNLASFDTLTCTQLNDFANEGAIPGTTCSVLQTVAGEICGCFDMGGESQSEVCTVCAEGVVRNPDGVLDVSEAGFPGLDTISCGQLSLLAQQELIPDEFCSPLQAASTDVCDCGEEKVVDSSCTVCAEGEVRNLDGVLDVSSAGIPGVGIGIIRCGELDILAQTGSIPDDSCPTMQELSVETCDCGPVDAISPPTFVCPICEEGVITNPNAEIEFSGQTTTCSGLEAFAASGQILEGNCPAVQLFARNTCICGLSDEDQVVLDLLQSTVGVAVSTPGTSEYLAAQYLLYEDPRFRQSRRSRRTMALYQDGPETEGGSGLPSNGTVDDDAKNEPVGDAPAVNPTVTSVIPLNDLTDAQIIQRYVMILLYFQTTDNLVEPWDSDCAADIVDSTIELRRQLLSNSMCVAKDGEESYKWLSEFLECEWEGVVCTEMTEEVSELNLSGLGLTGVAPTSVLLLPNLMKLDLSHNRLFSVIPDSYLISNTLESLNLSNNTLEGSVPTIENNGTLKILDVSYNQLESNLQIDSAPGLESLNLSFNDLTGDLSALEQIPGLVSLDVTNNRFAGNLSETDAFFQLDRLTTLLLGENFFSGTFPSGISSLGELTSLDLSQNNFQGNISSTLSELRELVTMDLSANAFGGTIPTELGLLTSLRLLILYDNFMTGQIPTELGNVAALEVANFGKNEFVGTLPDEVCAISSVEMVAADCEEVNCSCCSICCNEEGCPIEDGDDENVIV